MKDTSAAIPNTNEGEKMTKNHRQQTEERKMMATYPEQMKDNPQSLNWIKDGCTYLQASSTSV